MEEQYISENKLTDAVASPAAVWISICGSVCAG
jgi:hypothetical protein